MPQAVTRLLSPPRESFFLYGPRGTGKSTWLRQTFPQALFIDLLAAETHRSLLARPERLESLIDGLENRRGTVVIDEVQRIPELLPVVHRLLESEKAPRFVLTGSSARKLKRHGTDLLAGRALRLALHPFLAAELGKAFSLEGALKNGLIPLIWGAEDPRAKLEAYAGLYVKEEVRAEGLVRNLGDFARFLEAAALSHARQLNMIELARECQVGRKAAEGYLGVLEDLMLAFTLPVFTKRAKRRLTQHPKFYLVDAGLFRTLLPQGPLDTHAEAEGAALEGLVAQHLRAWADYSTNHAKLYFWRTATGLEVDFVAYGDHLFTAIEVKRSRRVEERDLTGLLAFKAEHPEAGLCLLYGGKERLRLKGIPCLPCDDFLRNLLPNKPLPC